MLQRCHAERRLHGGVGLYEKGDCGNIPKEKTGNVLICCKTWRLPLAGWKLYWGCSSPLPFPVPVKRRELSSGSTSHLIQCPVEKNNAEELWIQMRKLRLPDAVCVCLIVQGHLAGEYLRQVPLQRLTCHSLSLLLRNWCTTSTKVASVWYIR